MHEEQQLWKMLKTYPRRTFWLCSLLLLLFALMVLTIVTVGPLAFETREEAEAFFRKSLIIGFSILGVVYLLNWLICLRFLMKVKKLNKTNITDSTLERLLNVYTNSCILYMIPITFLKSLRGFGFTNRFANNKLKKQRNQDKTDQRFYRYVVFNESKRGLSMFFQVTKTK